MPARTLDRASINFTNIHCFINFPRPAFDQSDMTIGKRYEYEILSHKPFVIRFFAGDGNKITLRERAISPKATLSYSKLNLNQEAIKTSPKTQYGEVTVNDDKSLTLTFDFPDNFIMVK